MMLKLTVRTGGSGGTDNASASASSLPTIAASPSVSSMLSSSYFPPLSSPNAQRMIVKCATRWLPTSSGHGSDTSSTRLIALEQVEETQNEFKFVVLSTTEGVNSPLPTTLASHTLSFDRPLHFELKREEDQMVQFAAYDLPPDSALPRGIGINEQTVVCNYLNQLTALQRAKYRLGVVLAASDDLVEGARLYSNPNQQATADRTTNAVTPIVYVFQGVEEKKEDADEDDQVLEHKKPSPNTALLLLNCSVLPVGESGNNLPLFKNQIEVIGVARSSSNSPQTFEEALKFDPPPFDLHSFAASPRTFTIVNMWPKDASMQQLLLATVQITEAEMTLRHQKGAPAVILTTPTSLTLAGCAFRMGTYLIETAMKSASGIIDVSNDSEMPASFRVRLDVRQSTLLQLQQSGWDAVSPIPLSVVDQWCQFVSKKLSSTAASSSTSFPASLYSEAEKAVCAATVAQWIAVLVRFHHKVSLEWQSPLLALGMLRTLDGTHRIGVEAHKDEEDSGWPRNIAWAFKFLRCMKAPMLDTLLTSTPSVWNSSFENSKRQPVPPLPHPFSFPETQTEFAAMKRILDGNSWYHQPHLIRMVAEQFIRGERQSHASDVTSRQLHIQPISIEGMVPLNFMSPPGFSFDSINKEASVRLHFNVIDAAGRTWPMDLKFNRGIGELVSTQSNEGRGHTLNESSLYSGWNFGFQSIRGDAHSDQFEPHLSPLQQSVLQQAQALNEMNNKCWAEAATQTRQYLAEPNQDTSSSSHSSGTCFDICSSANSNIGQVELSMSNFRTFAFEQIALQVYPLLDFRRWGMSRYSEMHSKSMRRNFQSCLVDAAMKANNMNLFPTELLDIIADYWTLEAMPYLPPEEQQTLLTQATAAE